MPLNLQGSLSDFGNILSAVAALGMAAMGLMDATKVYRGGVSNIGLGFVTDAVAPYVEALKLVDKNDPYAVIRANWLNGVAKSDQKATVKSLIRLGLTTASATVLAAGAPGCDATALAAAAAKVDAGLPLTEQDIGALGRFDAIVDAQLDAAFERADQQYRNSAKVLAGILTIVLAVVGIWMIEGSALTFPDILLAILVGLISTPLAPVAKDITSALQSAVSTLKLMRG